MYLSSYSLSRAPAVLSAYFYILHYVKHYIQFVNSKEDLKSIRIGRMERKLTDLTIARPLESCRILLASQHIPPPMLVRYDLRSPFRIAVYGECAQSRRVEPVVRLMDAGILVALLGLVGAASGRKLLEK